MAAHFPDSVKSFTNPTTANKLSSPSHAKQHEEANDEITAIENNILGLHYNVMEYGATGDGVADDTDAIQDTIDAATLNNGTVLIPMGTFLISSTVNAASTVGLVIVKGGSIVKSASATLAINGSFQAGLYQVFSGFAAGDVTFGTETGVFANAVSVEWVYPEWWGAVGGDNATAQQTLNVTAFTSAFTTKRAVKIGPGYFYIDNVIAPAVSQYGLIEGSGRYKTNIVQTVAAKNIFAPTGTNATWSLTIRGITFRDGNSSIYISTSNNDLTLINIEDCLFYQPSAWAVESSSGSDSTVLNIDNCVCYTATNGGFAKTTSIDTTNITNCWLSLLGQIGFYTAGGRFHLHNLMGVAANNVEASCWVACYGGNVHLERCRFGGEDGGRTIVEYRSAVTQGNRLVLRDSWIYESTSVFLIKFYSLPEHIIIEGNYTYYNPGIWIDSACADPSLLMRGDVRIQDDIVAFPQGTSDNPEYNLIFNSKRNRVSHTSSNVLHGDVVIQILATGYAAPNLTSATYNDTTAYEYLGGVNSRQITSTADSASFDMLAGLSASLTNGIEYTAVFDVVVETTSPMSIKLAIMGTVAWFQLGNGTHVLNVPFVAESAVNANFTFFGYSMISGSKIRFGRTRVFKGTVEIKTVNTKVFDTRASTPTSNTVNYWYLGDKWEYSNPIASDFIGKFIKTAGVNGTEAWTTNGATSA